MLSNIATKLRTIWSKLRPVSVHSSPSPSQFRPHLHKLHQISTNCVEYGNQIIANGQLYSVVLVPFARAAAVVTGPVVVRPWTYLHLPLGNKIPWVCETKLVLHNRSQDVRLLELADVRCTCIHVHVAGSCCDWRERLSHVLVRTPYVTYIVTAVVHVVRPTRRRSGDRRRWQTRLECRRRFHWHASGILLEHWKFQTGGKYMKTTKHRVKRA